MERFHLQHISEDFKSLVENNTNCYQQSDMLMSLCYTLCSLNYNCIDDSQVETLDN